MTSSITSINNILEPVLFQVVGSTPESLADSVKKAGLEGRSEAGIQLAAICLFASAVNKNVLTTFLMKPELAQARSAVMSQFTISGNANMTALTLLGHCLYLTRFADKIVFAREFRKKMGQDSIWDGTLSGGSLSEKQRAILKDKSTSINVRSAGLLASGYLKFIGADPTAWTKDEADFWDVPHRINTPSPPRSNTQAPQSQQSPSHSRAGSSTSSSRTAQQGNYLNVPLSDGSHATLLRKAYEYYMAINNGDKERLTSSVHKNGESEWNARYGELADSDVDKKGYSGTGTVVG